MLFSVRVQWQQQHHQISDAGSSSQNVSAQYEPLDNNLWQHLVADMRVDMYSRQQLPAAVLDAHFVLD